MGKKGDEDALDKSFMLVNSPEFEKAMFIINYKKNIDDLKKMAKDSGMQNDASIKDQERELKIIMLNEIEKLDEK